MLFSETAHRVGILPIIIERIKTPLPKAHKSNAIVRAQNIDREATSTTIASQKRFGVLGSKVGIFLRSYLYELVLPFDQMMDARSGWIGIFFTFFLMSFGHLFLTLRKVRHVAQTK